jgi:hypothetical protein
VTYDRNSGTKKISRAKIFGFGLESRHATDYRYQYWYFLVRSTRSNQVPVPHAMNFVSKQKKKIRRTYKIQTYVVQVAFASIAPILNSTPYNKRANKPKQIHGKSVPYWGEVTILTYTLCRRYLPIRHIEQIRRYVSQNHETFA